MSIFQSLKSKHEQNKKQKEIQINRWNNYMRNCANKNRVAQIKHLEEYLEIPSIKYEYIIVFAEGVEDYTYRNGEKYYYLDVRFYNEKGKVIDQSTLPINHDEFARVFLKIIPFWCKGPLKSVSWNNGSVYDFKESFNGREPYGNNKENIDSTIKSEKDIFIKHHEIMHLGNNALLYLYDIIQCWKDKNFSELVGDYELWSEKKKFILSYEKVVNSEIHKRNLTKYTKEGIDEEESEELNETTENFGEKGELNVEYALKWLPKEYSLVIKNSNQKIFLKDTKISNEKQEVDHIVVGPNGVFSIETKYLKGNIKIDSNGNWSRVVEDDKIEGIKNPIQQVDRHHLIISSVLSDIVKDEDIHDIICLAYDTCTIEGVENSEIPVVKCDMITRHIVKTTSNKTYSKADIEKILATIEAFRETE